MLNERIEQDTLKVCFFTIRYTYVLKNMHLTHGMRSMHFAIPWKALCLHITTHTLKCFFSRNVRLTHVLVNVCFTKHLFYVRYRTNVKRALMNVRLICVTRFSFYHALNACFTHVAHFPVYIRFNGYSWTKEDMYQSVDMYVNVNATQFVE